VKIFKPVRSDKLVKEGLGKIKAKFKDVNSIGPAWITTFQDTVDVEEKELIKRDAYERINTFIDKLGIEEYK
jgi:dissimilatory sulfite reductase (desulfoviridin) alpha/beta subunit